MKRTCRITGQAFEITSEEHAFLERLAPVVGGRRLPLPLPTVCPEERKRQRLAFRNERNLYRRKCDFSGRSIISAYSPDKPCKVYANDIYWSDKWDGRSYGRDIDFSRPFFPQLIELKRVVPQIALITSADAEENNCPYVNFSGNSRNCYMTLDSDFNEDCCHGNVLKHSKYCIDCSYAHSCELCYECVDCAGCYELFYSQDCTNCSSSAFLRSCIGCADCFLCTNLIKKQYCIENKQYSKAEYERRRREFNLGSWRAVSELRRRFEQFHLQHPKKYCRILKAENCSGDYIQNAKNALHSFNIGHCEDVLYCDALYGAKDCLDVSSFGENIERVCYSGTIGINAFNIYFCEVCVTNVSDLIYCDNCRQAHNCFGCCSLVRQEYCILNRQYSKDEYEALVPRLVEHMQKTGEWGEFLPLEFSPFGYNETMAGEYYPLSRNEALQQGANWSDYEPPPVDVEVTPAAELPDDVANAADSALTKAVACSTSGKPFRMVKPELDFCRKMRVPLPRHHPDLRYRARMKLRNPQQLWARTCAKTGKPILTSYAPGRPEIVYCEEAFLETLI